MSEHLSTVMSLIAQEARSKNVVHRFEDGRQGKLCGGDGPWASEDEGFFSESEHQGRETAERGAEPRA